MTFNQLLLFSKHFLICKMEINTYFKEQYCNSSNDTPYSSFVKSFMNSQNSAQITLEITCQAFQMYTAHEVN